MSFSDLNIFWLIQNAFVTALIKTALLNSNAVWTALDNKKNERERKKHTFLWATSILSSPWIISEHKISTILIESYWMAFHQNHRTKFIESTFISTSHRSLDHSQKIQFIACAIKIYVIVLADPNLALMFSSI